MNGAIPPPPSSDAPPPPPSDALPPPPPDDDSAGPVLVKKPAKIAKKSPLDIDEILKVKRAADAAAAKPKFLSKKERERLAQREKEDAARKAASTNGNGVTNVSVNGSSKPSTPTAPRAPPTGPRAQNAKVPTGPAAMRANGMPPPPLPVKAKRNAEESESNMMRQRYLGPDMSQSNFSAQKKRKRTTEKKFNFSWDAEEDTSMDQSVLYQGQVEWRGKLGGFDDTERERKLVEKARQIEHMDKEHGTERARALLDMERQRKENARRFNLDLNWRDKRIENMRERDWRIFKEDFNISTKGGSIPNPMRTWDESGLPPEILRVVDQVGYTEPTPIQRAAIPIALKSRDLIGVAVTGSGKTAAFLLPMLTYIKELPPLNDFTKNDGPYAIVLAPTRELAQQIETEAKKFATPLGFTVVSIVGGHSIEEQAYQMRDGAEIIIATPGRLVDCIERRLIVLGQCCYVVMDEADRMIDLGFEEPVNRILSALPVSNAKPDTEDAENPAAMSQMIPVGGGAHRDIRYRQTMMYTATMPVAVERIARAYLRRPAIVTIGVAGEAVETVEQRTMFVEGEDRRKKRLVELLAQFAPPVIVFVNIKRNADAVARDVRNAGYSVVSLHGSKTQEQREASLAALRTGAAGVLVATDLAGRGIDVPDVSLVVNFNMATNIESYTHRIGRTGRAGKEGVAVTFWGSEDADVLYDLRQMLEKSSISKVPEDLKKHPAAQQKSTRGGGKKTNNNNEENAAKGRGAGGSGFP